MSALTPFFHSPGGAWTDRRMRFAMGTFVAIEATARSESTLLAGLEAAFAAVTRVDRLMHPTRAGSDVARINSAHPGEAAPITSDTWSVLRLAKQVHAASGGLFDPCLPALPGALDDLELSDSAAETCTVVCHRPLALDLGGIAKGHAVDRAIDALAAAGCISGLVNAGGDLRVFGERRETILLRHADRTCEPLQLENAALAVSDVDAQQRPSGHRGYYLRSARCTRRHRYAAVSAPEAAAADALTKCVLFGPHVRSARALRALGGRQILVRT
jgi:thiamine biosynthesis lipoprotein